MKYLQLLANPHMPIKEYLALSYQQSALDMLCGASVFSSEIPILLEFPGALQDL